MLLQLGLKISLKSRQKINKIYEHGNIKKVASTRRRFYICISGRSKVTHTHTHIYTPPELFTYFAIILLYQTASAVHNMQNPKSRRADECVTSILYIQQVVRHDNIVTHYTTPIHALSISIYHTSTLTCISSLERS